MMAPPTASPGMVCRAAPCPIPVLFAGITPGNAWVTARTWTERNASHCAPFVSLCSKKLHPTCMARGPCAMAMTHADACWCMFVVHTTAYNKEEACARRMCMHIHMRSHMQGAQAASGVVRVCNALAKSCCCKKAWEQISKPPRVQCNQVDSGEPGAASCCQLSPSPTITQLLIPPGSAMSNPKRGLAGHPSRQQRTEHAA